MLLHIQEVDDPNATSLPLALSSPADLSEAVTAGDNRTLLRAKPQGELQRAQVLVRKEFSSLFREDGCLDELHTTVYAIGVPASRRDHGRFLVCRTLPSAAGATLANASGVNVGLQGVVIQPARCLKDPPAGGQSVLRCARAFEVRPLRDHETRTRNPASRRVLIPCENRSYA